MLNNRQEVDDIRVHDSEAHEDARIKFTERMIRLGAIACELSKNNDEDTTTKSEKYLLTGLKALDTQGGLQEMLAAQMLSIHQLQQISMAMIQNGYDMNSKQYFTNTAIKLANTFTQQANLLARLQGNGGQKIVVEHVDIHHGGQAIVGNINTPPPQESNK